MDEDDQTARVWWGCDYAGQGFPAAEPSLATRLKGKKRRGIIGKKKKEAIRLSNPHKWGRDLVGLRMADARTHTHTRARTYPFPSSVCLPGLLCIIFLVLGVNSRREALSILRTYAPASLAWLATEHQDPETSANRITRMLNTSTSLSRLWRLLIG